MLTDLTARKFGALLVLRYATDDKKQYVCKCDCGNEVTVPHTYLMSDKKKSCGCLSPANKYKPGTRKLHEIWKSVLARVQYRKKRGDKGELIHPDWLDYKPFAEWAVSQAYVDGQMLAPVPNGKSFSPLNCSWIWQGESRRVYLPRLTKVNGVPLDLRQLAQDCDVPYMTLYMRLRKGWTLLDAITRPVGRQNRRTYEQN